MVTLTSPAAVSNKMRWVGYGVGGLAVLFLLLDMVIKLLQLAPAVEATTALGYPAAAVLPLGVIELLCVAIYLFPRTATLGGVLLTGYLGGAVAIHVRNGSPLFALVFPLIIGALVWLSLWLLDGRTQTLFAARG